MTRFGYLLPLMVVIILLFCAGCLLEQYAPGITNDTTTTHHAVMHKIHGAVINETQAALDALDFTIADGAETLGRCGIPGPEAEAVLETLAAYDPAVMNVITYDPNGTVSAAAPDEAHVLIGQSLIGYDIVKEAVSTRKPQMSNLLTLAEGGVGAVIAYPIFSSDGTFLGVVSAAFSPYGLIAPVTEEAMEWAPFTYNVAQTDGRILYHADPALVGKQTFNETTFADFPEIIELAQRYAGNRSGYATFSFYSTGTGKIVQKETFWDTVGLHGTEWRVMVIGERG